MKPANDSGVGGDAEVKVSAVMPSQQARCGARAHTRIIEFHVRGAANGRRRRHLGRAGARGRSRPRNCVTRPHALGLGLGAKPLARQLRAADKKRTRIQLIIYALISAAVAECSAVDVVGVVVVVRKRFIVRLIWFDRTTHTRAPVCGQRRFTLVSICAIAHISGERTVCVRTLSALARLSHAARDRIAQKPTRQYERFVDEVGSLARSKFTADTICTRSADCFVADGDGRRRRTHRCHSNASAGFWMLI